MGKIYASLTILLGFTLSTQAQSQDSFQNLVGRLNQIELENNGIKRRLDTLAYKYDSVLRVNKAPGAAAKKEAGNCTTSTICYENGRGWILPLLPIALFIGAWFLVARHLKQQGFELRDALSSFRSNTKVTTTRSLAADGTVTSQTEKEDTADQPVRSTSRLIAFLTAITALIIATVLTSYVGYRMVTGCGTDVPLDSLWKILVALGIGVIPYGANMLSGNAKENPTPGTAR